MTHKMRLVNTTAAAIALGPMLLLADLSLSAASRGVDRPVSEKSTTITTTTAAAKIVKTVQVSNRAELQRAVLAATPGTKILIASGTYRGGLAFRGLRGERGKPIILAAENPQRPPIIDGGTNCLHLSDPEYVQLHNLILRNARGNGLNIDDAGTFESPARHIVLLGLVVSDIGPDGNRDGIKLSGVDEFRVENCTIKRWGSRGSAVDMVGCHRGLISRCTFRGRKGNLGSGVQTKGGSREITIRRCRFEQAGARAVNIGGSTDLEYFRPKPLGYEAKDITVEDNTFLGSIAPLAFVGVDGAVVRHNTIYRPHRWVIRILQETRGPEFVPCRNGRFSNNLIVFRTDELNRVVNIGGGTAPETFRFRNNFWHCLNAPERTRTMVRLPVAEIGGMYGCDPKFRDAKRGDLRLMPNSPAVKSGPRAP